MYRKFGKRLMDLVLSGIALIPLSVVYLVLAVAIKMDDEEFKQQLVRLETACKDEFSAMKDIVAEIVPTYKRKIEV